MKIWYCLGLMLLVCLLGIHTYFEHFAPKKEKPEQIIEQQSQEPQEPLIQEEAQPEPELEQEIKPEPIIEPEPSVISLGVYKITAYCGCTKCCGKTDGITASGTHVTAGRTIAAPPEIQFGTKLIINGHAYTVEDRGGAIKGKRIDIYFDSHQEAVDFGVQYIEVFKVIK
jgi:3D (Asp-Asp-Asp) domain-containing protein